MFSRLLKTKNLSGDLWGGFAAMLVALPSAIAFGVVIYSVLGPEYAPQGAMAGILGAVAMGIFAPLFGGADRLISAPCAPAAAVMAGLAAGLTGSGLEPQKIFPLMILAALLSGSLQCLYGAIGGGRLIKYIPYPVVSGYLSGVAVLIFLGQIPRLFGFPKEAGLWAGLSSPELWRGPGVVVGTATMAVMLLAPKITRAVPAAILGLLSGVGSYFALGIFYPGLLSLSENPLVIGSISAGGSLFSAADRFNSLTGLGLGDLRAVIVPALTLSVLLSIDTLKTCVVVDALTRSRHNSNRELIGQGIGNLASALFGGMPGAGTMGATLVNLSSGGTTRLSSVLEGVFALSAFLLLGTLVAWVPVAALAGILIVVAYRMFDWGSFHLLKQKSTAFDFAVAAAVIVTAVGVDLIVASGAGLAFAIFLFIRDQIRGSVIRRKCYGNQLFSKQRRLPSEMEILEERGAQAVVCELQGNLFFGTTDQLFSELEKDLKSVKYAILDMRRVQSVDFTAAHMLEQIEAHLAERKGKLLFSGLPQALPTGQDLQKYFNQLGLVRPSRSIRIFNSLNDALEWTEDRILKEAGLEKPGEEALLKLDEIDLMREFEPEFVSAMRQCLEKRDFEPEKKIFSQGDSGDEVYLIRRGLVRIVLPLGGEKSHHVVTFGRGDFFGDMAFLDRGTRSADAVAVKPTDLYVLSRARFNEFSLKYPMLGAKVFARLARALAIRLRQTDTELRALQES